MATHREASRRDWNIDDKITNKATREEIQLGCIQRIADGVERMEKNLAALEADRD